MARKIVIIGAGIIGAAIGYHLSRDGADVTVIEKSAPASGATSKSFAWINAHFTETPEFFALRMASIAAWQTLEKEIDHADFKVRWGGSLSWGDSNEDHKGQIQAPGNPDYRVETINPAEFSTLEPAVRPPDGDCLHALDEGAIDPVAATRVLLQAAARHGAKMIYGCGIDRLLMQNNRITGVATPYGEIATDEIVVAAGVWSQNLLADAGVGLPMDNSYSIIVRSTPAEPLISRVMLSPDVHFRQDIDGSVIFAESFVGGEIGGDPSKSATKILKLLRHRVPGLRRIEIENIFVGNRPIPADGFPVIGRASGTQGLYLASMHSGITLAPIVGRLASEEILANRQSDLLAPYRLSRFQ